jgi:hypothetical protein
MEGGTLTVANGTLSLNVAQGGFGTADTGGLGAGGDLVEQLEPHPLASPLQPIAVACVVDQDPLHRFRRGGEEVSSDRPKHRWRRDIESSRVISAPASSGQMTHPSTNGRCFVRLISLTRTREIAINPDCFHQPDQIEHGAEQ